MVFDPDRRRVKRMTAAEGYLMLDLPDRALQELSSIDDLGDAACEWHLLRGEAFRKKADHAGGLAAFTKALELNDSSLEAMMGMAWCYKRLDRLSDSIEIMRRAYQSHQDVPVVLYNLACYYSLAGEKDQALSWLGRALRMDRDLGRLIPQEADFDPIRADPDFRHLLELSVA